MSDALSSKSVAELKSMVANAERILAGPSVKMHPAAQSFMEAAKAALSTRRATGTTRAPDEALDAAIARIKEVAAEAAGRFDLTALTATAGGVKAPHRLLSPKGEPKVGGGVRSGKFSRCPYISYSGRDGIAMLQYAVPKGDAAPFWSGGLTVLGSPESKTNFDTPMGETAAIEAFLTALAGVAPARA